MGSPTRLRLILAETPSLLSFVERCVIPYLYGYSIVESGGVLPFGELSHGTRGLRDDLAAMLGVDDDLVLLGFVRLLAKKKREANKLPCPCGSGMRLGRCHNRKLNTLREKLGRGGFRLYSMGRVESGVAPEGSLIAQSRANGVSEGRSVMASWLVGGITNSDQEFFWPSALWVVTLRPPRSPDYGAR